MHIQNRSAKLAGCLYIGSTVLFANLKRLNKFCGVCNLVYFCTLGKFKYADEF